MKLNIKVKFEEDLFIDVESIRDEDFAIYTYSEKQLKAIRKKLFEIIGQDEISSEDEMNCKGALEIIQNALYINSRINIKELDSFYLRTLDNEE